MTPSKPMCVESFTEYPLREAARNGDGSVAKEAERAAHASLTARHKSETEELHRQLQDAKQEKLLADEARRLADTAHREIVTNLEDQIAALRATEGDRAREKAGMITQVRVAENAARRSEVALYQGTRDATALMAQASALVEAAVDLTADASTAKAVAANERAEAAAEFAAARTVHAHATTTLVAAKQLHITASNTATHAHTALAAAQRSTAAAAAQVQAHAETHGQRMAALEAGRTILMLESASNTQRAVASILDARAQGLADGAPRASQVEDVALNLQRALASLHVALPKHSDAAGHLSGTPHEEFHATVNALSALVNACEGAAVSHAHARLIYTAGTAVLATVVGAFYHRRDRKSLKSRALEGVALFLHQREVPSFAEGDKVTFPSTTGFEFSLEAASAEVVWAWWNLIMETTQDLNLRGEEDAEELAAFQLQPLLEAPQTVARPMITEPSQSRAPSLALTRLRSEPPNWSPTA
jgi:hypothetical protein